MSQQLRLSACISIATMALFAVSAMLDTGVASSGAAHAGFAFTPAAILGLE